MKRYKNNKPLFSIHIPKCCGTSLGKLLKHWFGEKLHFHYFDEENNKYPVMHKLLADTCIHGHFNSRRGFGIQDYYPDADQFITIIRDPFDIVVSRYFDVKRREQDIQAYWAGESIQLPDDVNIYLEREVSKKDYHPNILDYMPTELTHDNYRDFIETKFIYIGVASDLQFSVNRIADKLGYPPIKVPRLNTSYQFQEPSQDIARSFVESHPIEYAIYRYILKNYRYW